MKIRSSRYFRAMRCSTRAISASGSSSAWAATGSARSRPVALQGAIVTEGLRRMRFTL